jgi:hypothetical protein
MIEWRYNYDKPVFMSYGDRETIKLFRQYVSYLSTLKFDDMYHWSQEELEFYNNQTFEIPIADSQIR